MGGPSGGGSGCRLAHRPGRSGALARAGALPGTARAASAAAGRVERAPQHAPEEARDAGPEVGELVEPGVVAARDHEGLGDDVRHAHAGARSRADSRSDTGTMESSASPWMRSTGTLIRRTACVALTAAMEWPRGAGRPVS